MSDIFTVWVFNGDKGRFPSGVFSSRERAEQWIGINRLSGTLTEYPVDVGAYDWALDIGYFKPKRDNQKSAEFRQNFSSAYQAHEHYINGEME